MSCLLTAISARWPGVADDAFVLLEREGANIFDPAVAVANELASIAGRGTIVVDDLHLAAPAPTVLSAFIDALPEHFRFVIGTRSDPPLSLARLRLSGQLLELRRDDLRFGRRELSEFFLLQDVVIRPDDLDRMHDLTEGWPAGAQLAALALQRSAERDDFLGALASTDRTVGDFLVSEVLASLAPDLVEFLVETSVLETFDAELCAAITGVEDAAVILETLIAANLFLIELDDPPRWFRFHHLFGAFLRARLALLGSARVRAAHERASRALEARGDVAAALRHAMAIADVDRAGQILRRAVTRSMSMSEGADDAVRAVRLWLHEVGVATIGTDPVLVLELLIGLISISRPEDAPVWLERVRRAHPTADDRLTAMIEGAWGEHLDNHGQPLEAVRRMRQASDAIGGRPPNDGLLALVHVATARAHLHAGQVDEARTVLRHARDHPVGHPVADDVRTRGVAAFVAALDGELGVATELVGAVVESADLLGLERHEPGRIYADLAMLVLHIERNELENARELVVGIRAAAELGRRVTVQSEVLLQHAKLARHVGDEAGAEALLAQSRLLYPEPDAAVRQVLGEEAVAQALRFDPDRASPLIAALDQEHPATQVLLIRFALLEHQDRRAAELLAALAPPTARRARVERSVLRALSVLDRDVEQANHLLGEAMVHGQPERLVRVIVDQSVDVHKLLISFAPTSSQEAYLDALLSAANRDVAPIRSRITATLVDPLSAREVTVLRYLCSRLTYQEIAAALFVSLNTLKSHVRTVYRKLGVASRADAVEVGRRFGVI
jgi:LuxR family transcriptional regulator, maltose regulon positive regulatory protein